MIKGSIVRIWNEHSDVHNLDEDNLWLVVEVDENGYSVAIKNLINSIRSEMEDKECAPQWVDKGILKVV